MKIIIVLVFTLFFFSVHAKGSGENKKQTRIFCEIQQRLQHIGISPGKINGKANEDTQKALSQFLDTIKPQKDRISLQDILIYLREYRPNKKLIKLKKTEKRPEHGAVYIKSNQRALAPLQLKTGSKEYDYFVKLLDVKTGRTIKSFYLRGGYVFKTRLPLGNYYLKYATGKKWYSHDCLFGINTLYSKADKVFNFSRNGNRLTGYTVELILQTNGNLSTRRLKPEQW